MRAAILNFPKHLSMERMILVLLLVAHYWRQPLEHKLQALRGLNNPSNGNHAKMCQRVKGLVTLLFGYVAALFLIGSQVRDCHWLPQDEGQNAEPL